MYSKPLPFHISFDTEELSHPRRSKMTPQEALEIYRRERRLGFVAYLEGGQSEATTLLGRDGSQFQSGPKENWDWDAVRFIGAGTIEAGGTVDFQVFWKSGEAKQRFGRSHPANFEDHCRVDEQVKKDFAEFLAMAERGKTV